MTVDALALLAVAGTLPPLTSPSGEPYRHEQLPCTLQPRWWDADAEWPERLLALASCRTCPALAACRERRWALDGLVAGVLAGEDVPEPAEPAANYDTRVLAWLAQAGVVVKPPTPARKRRRTP